MFKIQEMGVAIARMNKARILPSAIVATIIEPEDIGKKVDVNERVTALIKIGKFDVSDVDKRKKRKELQEKLEDWLEEGKLAKKLDKAFADAVDESDDEESKFARGGKKRNKRKRHGPKAPKCENLRVISFNLVNAESVLDEPGDFEGSLILRLCMVEV